MNKFIKPLIFLLTFAIGDVFAQSSGIKGIVRTADGLPAEYVNVGLEGSIKGGITNAAGEYRINNVNPGKYVVFTSFVGLERMTKEVEVLPNTWAEIEFVLNEKATDLLEVVVSDIFSNRFYNDSNFAASKLPIRDIENPQVFQSIGKALLKEQVVTNFNDALRNATGVSRIWESTGRGGDGAEYYTMRGFSVQPTMVNGMPGINNGGIDPANIESIDVLKGPAGTLYGSPMISYGGLINITTKRPLDRFQGEVGFITGSFGMNRFTADVNVPLNEEISTRVNLAYQTQNSFQDAGGKKSLFVAPSFKIKANDKLTFLINTEFIDREAINAPMIFLNRNVPLSFNSIEPFERNYENSFTSNQLSIRNPTIGLQTQALYRLSDAWTSQTVFSSSSTKSMGYYHYLWDSGDGDSFTRFISKRNGQTNVTDIQQNFIGDTKVFGLRNRLVIGIDYMNMDIQNSSSGWVGNGRITLSDGNDTGLLTQSGVDRLLEESFEGNSTASTQVLSAYINDVINITSNLSVMAGLRIDNFKGSTEYWVTDEIESQVAVSPKFGVVYQPIKDKVSIFGNYMNGFVNVPPTEVSDVDGSNPRLKIFEPENADQYEFGIKTNIYQNRISATASYYNITVKNRLMGDPNNINNSIQGGEVLSKGVEFSLVANPINGLNLIAGYAYNHSEVTKDNPGDGYLGLRPEEAGPQNLLNFWASYTLLRGSLKGLGFGFGGNAASEHLTLNRSNIGTFAIPAYQVFNGLVSYNANNYMIAMKVNNITNQKYYSGWSTVTPQALRNISLNLNYRF
jgi:iron complex outermembrane recepter protein